MTIEFKVEVDKSQIEIFDSDEGKSPEVKAFQVQFRTPESSKEGPKILGFIRTKKEGMISSMQFLIAQSMDGMDYKQGLTVSYNEATDSGWSKQARPTYDQATKNIKIVEEDLGWNSRFFKLSDKLCLNREEFVDIGESYKLFDNKGALVNVETHIDVEKTIEVADSATLASTGKVIKAGTKFMGSVTPWGFHVWVVSVPLKSRFSCCDSTLSLTHPI